MINAHPRSQDLTRRGQQGLTLIELMVALVIGLLIVMAMSVMFLGSSRSRRELDLSADAIESGRYALDLLSRELSQAGFYDTLAAPTGSTNDPCSIVAATWAASLTFHVFGWNSVPSPGTSDADPACVTRKAGTDAIFIQRASTCYVGQTNCETESSSYGYIQVSQCGSEYSSKVLSGLNPFVVGAGLSSFPLQSVACDGSTTALKRKLIRRIYYVSAANALTYVDIQLSGFQAPVTLVENIEQMQIDYAIASSTSAGTAQTFSPSPTAAQWPLVVGARVSVLARSTDSSSSAASAVSFQMGEFTGSNAVSFAAATTNPKRRVYATYIPFTTPKSRMEPS